MNIPTGGSNEADAGQVWREGVKGRTDYKCKEGKVEKTHNKRPKYNKSARTLT